MYTMREKPSRNTKEKLSGARYFLGRMIENQKDSDAHTSPFRFNFEAFLAFFRSITFVMQKELAHYPGFEEWYATQVEWMTKDPQMKLLAEMRNIALKQESVQTRTTMEVSVAEVSIVAAAGSVAVTITDKNGNIVEQRTVKEEKDLTAAITEIEKPSSKLVWHIEKTSDIEEILSKFSGLDADNVLKTDIITICKTCFEKLEPVILDFLEQDKQ